MNLYIYIYDWAAELPELHYGHRCLHSYIIIFRTWAVEFILLGGYDQEAGIMPSSRQDCDLRDRCIQAWKRHAQIIGGAAPSEGVLQMRVGIGSAIPNATTKLEDRGVAKICNVDPAILREYQTWKSMLNRSAKLLAEKVGQLVRNYSDPYAHQNKIYQILKDDKAIHTTWELFQSSLNLSTSILHRSVVFSRLWVSLLMLY